MAARQQHADRATHRVSNSDHGRHAERFEQERCIVGNVFQLEWFLQAQPAAVAAVVERDERTLGGQRFVRCEELEITACGPTVPSLPGSASLCPKPSPNHAETPRSFLPCRGAFPIYAQEPRRRSFLANCHRQQHEPQDIRIAPCRYVRSVTHDAQRSKIPPAGTHMRLQ